MKLHYLRYFQMVCRYQNSTRAAKALHISQPSISYAIKELETEFDIALFTRKSHGFMLTQEGEEFLKLCDLLLQQADLTERSMHDLAGRHCVIRIGITPMLGLTLYPRWYKELHAQFPDIEFQRHEHGSITLRRLLREGLLDCGIFPEKYADCETCDSALIETARYVCCVGKGHPLALQKSITVPQLKDEPLVIQDETFANNQYVHDMFRKYSLTPKVIMETNQFETIRNMISKGKTVSFIYKSFVDLYPGLVAIPIEDSDQFQRIGLVWVRNRHILSDLDKVIHFTKKGSF